MDPAAYRTTVSRCAGGSASVVGVYLGLKNCLECSVVATVPFPIDSYGISPMVNPIQGGEQWVTST